MHDTLRIDLEGDPAAGTELPLLMRWEYPLERLSGRLRLAKLCEFYDYSGLDSIPLGVGLPPADGAAAAAAWFDPRPALRTVGTLHEHLRRHPDDLRPLPDEVGGWPIGLLSQLHDCRVALETAVAAERRFRLQVVSP